MIKKYFLIFLSFILIISIIPVDASNSKWTSIQPALNDWIIISNNNVYLYSGYTVEEINFFCKI